MMRLTTQAIIAANSGDPTCETCRGTGRLQVTSARDVRVCPACGGRGIPRSLRDWTYDNVGRDDFKAYRQATR
jgi:hypothetical protein